MQISTRKKLGGKWSLLQKYKMLCRQNWGKYEHLCIVWTFQYHDETYQCEQFGSSRI